MKRKDFIAKVVTTANVDKDTVTVVLEAIETEALNIIATEDSVRFKFGTLSGVAHAARTARNPKTGETVQVPEKHGCPKFKASKAAKE